MPNRLHQVRARFESRIAAAEHFVDRCSLACHASTTARSLNLAQMEWAYEASLVKIIIASEEFFENSLGLFVLGQRTPSGYRPRRRRTLDTSLPQALDVFRGDQDFVGWNSPTTIIDRAERWLRNGEPFRTPLSAGSQLLVYLRRMRNLICHDSDSAFEEYERATRALYGALPSRLIPGAQLLASPPGPIPHVPGSNLFETVVAAYRFIAQQVVRT